MGKVMDAQALRTWLAQRLRQPDVPDMIWGSLVDTDYVHEALELSEEGREDLLREARRLMCIWRSGMEHAKSSTRTVRVSDDRGILSPYEFERQMAVATYLAKQAEMSAEVRRFRAEYSSASVPEPNEMPRLHVGGEDERDYQGDESGTSPTSHGLDDLVRWLRWRYGWGQTAAREFLLERRSPDDPPVPAPIEVRVEDTSRPERKNGRIVLLAEPWLSAETVLRAYRKVQRWALGGDNRPIKEKNLRVFEFVESQKHEGQRPRWATLLERWNEDNSEELYSDLRHFVRDYHRTKTALLSPQYPFLHNVEGDEV